LQAKKSRFRKRTEKSTEGVKKRSGKKARKKKQCKEVCGKERDTDFQGSPGKERGAGERE